MSEEQKAWKSFYRTVIFTLLFASVMWLCKWYEVSSGFRLTRFGIYPRAIDGSLGILTGPFVHGSWDHLISNTFPLVVTLVLIFTFYKRVALSVVVVSWIFTGFLVWMFARPSYHIGASGVVYSLIAFILGSGLFKRNSLSTMLALLMLAIYSSYFVGFQQEEGVSWESHILGSLVGFALAFLLRSVKENFEDYNESPSKEAQVRQYFLPRDVFVKTKYQRWLDQLAEREAENEP